MVKQFKSVRSFSQNIKNEKTSKMPNKKWDTIGVVKGHETIGKKIQVILFYCRETDNLRQISVPESFFTGC